MMHMCTKQVPLNGRLWSTFRRSGTGVTTMNDAAWLPATCRNAETIAGRRKPSAVNRAGQRSA